MAKLTGPLFSVSASGSIGSVLTYSSWKGISISKMLGIPTDLKTPAQQKIRSVYRAGVDVWNLFMDPEKKIWNDKARGVPFTGFNLFLRDYINTNFPLADFAVYGSGKYGVDTYGI